MGSLSLLATSSDDNSIRNYTHRVTTTTSPDRLDVIGPTVTRVTLIGALLSLFVVIAVTGNTLVIVAILTDRRLRKPSNFFLLSLAVADTLVALFVMTFAVVNVTLQYWPFGRVFCDVWLSADVMCSTASILHLLAVSLDRYISVKNPFHYSRVVTCRRSLLAIAIIWLVSALLSVVPIHLGWHRIDTTETSKLLSDPTATGQLTSINASEEHFSSDSLIPFTNGYANTVNLVYETRSMDCDKSLSDVDLQRTNGGPTMKCEMKLNVWYAVVSSSVSFYIPCIVMMSIYWRLYRYARIHAKCISKAMTVSSSIRSCSDNGERSRIDNRTRVNKIVLNPENETLIELSCVRSEVAQHADTVTENNCSPVRNGNGAVGLAAASDLLSVFNGEVPDRKRCGSCSMLTSSNLITNGPCLITNPIEPNHCCLRRGHSSDDVTLNQIKTIKPSLVVAEFVRHPSIQVPRERSMSVFRQSEYKAAVTLGIIMGVFLICWAPFFTLNVVAALLESWQHPLVFSVFTWLGYLNSTMNPVIYGVFNQEFRTAFRKVLTIKQSFNRRFIDRKFWCHCWRCHSFFLTSWCKKDYEANV